MYVRFGVLITLAVRYVVSGMSGVIQAQMVATSRTWPWCMGRACVGLVHAGRHLAAHERTAQSPPSTAQRWAGRWVGMGCMCTGEIHVGECGVHRGQGAYRGEGREYVGNMCTAGMQHVTGGAGLHTQIGQGMHMGRRKRHGNRVGYTGTSQWRTVVSAEEVSMVLFRAARPQI